jgi:hypothetical protein
MDRRTKEIGSLSYISTDTFNNNIFSYTVTNGPSPQFKKIGTLAVLSGATSVNCPAGHILRENGKKLYPDAHNGVTTYMVGVFDMLSGLKGYINPNDPMFAPYNTDRPLYQLDSVYTTSGTTKNLGPSVLTLGDVTVGGNLILNSGNTGVSQMALGTDDGTFRKLTVSAPYCRSTSKVMLTYTGLNNPGVLSAEGISNGSFVVVSTNRNDAGVVMYLIVN